MATSLAALASKAVSTVTVNSNGNVVDIRAETFTPEMKQILDFTFNSLIASKPAWRNGFRDKEETIAYKKQLGVAMAEHGIDTSEKLAGGLAYARSVESPFMPSVGEFIGWCKDVNHEREHAQAIEARTQRILDERKQLASRPFEERQHEARAHLMCCREIIKKNRGAA